jgi:O-antigen ligase
LSLAATSGAFPPPAPARRGFSLVRLRDRLTAISVFAGFFVMVEPSPNEVVVSLGLLVLLATGLSFPRQALPLLWLLIGLNIGGAFSALPVMAKEKVATFVVISVFLMAYCLYFVALLSENALRRLELLRVAWVAGAVLAAACGIAGYFDLFGTRALFTLYGSRAKGTFNDPNVLGPFLVLPIVLIVQGFVTGAVRRPALATAALGVVTLGLFLTFSRAAWIHALASVALLTFLTFVTTRSTWQRTRITLIVACGALAFAAALALVAATPEVREMVLLRANLAQDYDVRAGGRFDNFRRAFDVIVEHPNGIGPHEFGRRFGEDPHNAYLHTFVAYGWLGGMSYLALVLATLWIGWTHVWSRTPYQPWLIAAVATFTGVAGIGVVIHSDHWRHWYLLVAMIWALVAATRREVEATP